ncbi:MAG: hypothetical protein ACI9JP_001005, partial [Granulosicoccus sp.]
DAADAAQALACQGGQLKVNPSHSVRALKDRPIIIRNKTLSETR